MGVAGSPVIGRRRGAFSTLLRRPGLWASSDGVLATKSERKMLASTCLYSLYAWFNKSSAAKLCRCVWLVIFSSAISTTVTALNFVGGRTSTSAALHLLRTDLFTVPRGARDSVPQVAVIVTDGGLDNLQNTTEEVFFVIICSCLSCSFTDHCSGAGRAIGPLYVFVCLFIRTITFELNDLWPKHMECWFNATLLGQVRQSRS